MSETHSIKCWKAAYSAAIDNGADSIEAFNWAHLWLTETGDKDCECKPGEDRVDRRGFAFSRS